MDVHAALGEHPATPETDQRMGLSMAVAVGLLPALALWAAIWYALTRLILGWP